MYNFFELVSKLTISDNADSDVVKWFGEALGKVNK